MEIRCVWQKKNLITTELGHLFFAPLSLSHSHFFSFSSSFPIILLVNSMAPIITPEVTSNLQWVSQMNVDIEPTAGRKSSIIGTIGKF